jgi:hypothetical protein
MKSRARIFVVAGAVALALGLSTRRAQEPECDGVLMQGRLALANCIVESAVAADVISQEGCNEGSWDIGALVDEYYLSTMPTRGSLMVQGGGSGDSFVLNGKVSAVSNPARNNVLCGICRRANRHPPIGGGVAAKSV